MGIVDGGQIGVSLILSLLLSLTNFLNPMKKGQALSDILLLFVMSGTVSGDISARLFKFCGGKNWKLNTLYTASAFPGACMVIFVVLNTFLAFYGTAKTVSFWTIFLVFFLWTCVSAPLVCVGSFFGVKLDPISVPTRTNQIARVIPTLHWTFRSFLSYF
jgi:transmembrane 9 superfamily protein 2/4